MTTKQKRVSIHTLGCKLNQVESSAILEQFRSQGYAVVPFGDVSDVVIINTCTVTEQADVECRKLARRVQRENPEAILAVTGCYAQLQPQELASIDGVRGVFGTAEKHTIAAHVETMARLESPLIAVDETHDDMDFIPASYTNDGRTRAFLKLQDGCDYSCSFCTIPKARGGSRSMPFVDIEDRLEQIEEQSYAELVLTGVNLGEYHANTGERFVDVLRLIDARPRPFRVRISSIEPNTVRDSVLEAIAQSSSVCPHLHIPLQSGSATILRNMRRRYTPSSYASLVERIQQRISQCTLGIDVIVGFPGETDELFEETYSFLENIPFTYLHVFTYSERADTPAAVMLDSVPRNVRRARTARLRALSEVRKRAAAVNIMGSNRFVLPETYDDATGMWTGWTEDYHSVNFAAPPGLHKRLYSCTIQHVIDKRGVLGATLVEPPIVTSDIVSLPILHL